MKQHLLFCQSNENVRVFLLFVTCLCLYGCSTTNRLTGHVIKVQDGDTMTLLMDGNEQVKIRLDGIDAPELGQDFSQKSKAYLAELVADKEVMVIHKGKDQYDRVLGVVFVGKLNVNEEMLRSGLAWRYRYNNDPVYLALQEEAMDKQLNIWSMKNSIDPWVWRKMKRK